MFIGSMLCYLIGTGVSCSTVVYHGLWILRAKFKGKPYMLNLSSFSFRTLAFYFLIIQESFNSCGFVVLSDVSCISFGRCNCDVMVSK